MTIELKACILLMIYIHYKNKLFHAIIDVCYPHKTGFSKVLTEGRFIR
jgi:hypothetical protein